MPEKKKTDKKEIKVHKRDLKPAKDPKGGPGGNIPGHPTASRTRQDVASRVW